MVIPTSIVCSRWFLIPDIIRTRIYPEFRRIVQNKSTKVCGIYRSFSLLSLFLYLPLSFQFALFSALLGTKGIEIEEVST